MKHLKELAAAGLQAGGLLIVAAGVYTVSKWAGLVVLGAGLVAFGVALERS